NCLFLKSSPRNKILHAYNAMQVYTCTQIAHAQVNYPTAFAGKFFLRSASRMKRPSHSRQSFEQRIYFSKSVVKMGRDAQPPASRSYYNLRFFEMGIEFHGSPAARVLKAYDLRFLPGASRANDSVVAPAQLFAQVICQITQVGIDSLDACFE